MNKKFLTVALLVILPFFLTACTLQDLPVIGKFFAGAAKKSGTVTVWGLWENPEVMDALIANYKEKNPNVTVNYDDRSIMKSDQYRETILARMNEGKDVPDIVLVHNSWVKRVKDSLSPAPAGVLDAKTYSSTFYPVANESAVIDGKVYAVPMYYDGLALVYSAHILGRV
jgi:ABC-type glycerol-3-phosphate transport system substrate-binding protein